MFSLRGPMNLSFFDDCYKTMKIDIPTTRYAWIIHAVVWIVSPLLTHVRSFFAECIEGFEWLFRGPELLEKRYVHGTPFRVRTRTRLYHLFSSREHIEEISRANEDNLSLVAIAEEVFQPQHTMNGIELNRLGLQRRILRTISLKLGHYQNPITDLVRMELSRALSGGPSTNGWRDVEIFTLTQKVVTRANTHTFYGQNFTDDASFLEAALQYPRDVFVAAEVLRCVPKAFAGPACWLATRGHKASKHLTAKLIPMIERRIACENSGATAEQKDYVQHVIDLYPDTVEDRAHRIVEQTLALWFASVHQPAITLYYALLDICEYPEVREQLLAEIHANRNPDGSIHLDKLILLDSFLKESARLNTSESISLRRKALRPFTFKDGTHVGAGDWACIPQRPIMRDPLIYSRPDTFDLHRFLPKGDDASGSKQRARFTDLNPMYPIWGLGRQACPGRFYASFITKLVLVEMLSNYDFKMDAVPAQRYFSWRSSLIPRPRLQFQLRQNI
ncbi:cytochrome P450 [Amniculicola lignicola CBS 123094]|uniref:Cytochrome P450 n=1 Tax=Amniculicola lignicola CBS 123094 TaxID=1392246 RepID=A0A6A5W414_9PLEO|nr:cytochrome P450 [Amniculicola lignicola CBS 123094]